MFIVGKRDRILLRVFFWTHEMSDGASQRRMHPVLQMEKESEDFS